MLIIKCGFIHFRLGIQQTPDKTMWESGIGNISFTGGNDHYKKFDISNMPVKFHVEAFSNYSYHCRKLVTEPVLRGYNSTTKLAVSLTLNKFQVCSCLSCRLCFHSLFWHFDSFIY